MVCTPERDRDRRIADHKLRTAYEYYCTAELKNAHSAMADTQATLQIFIGQLQRCSSLFDKQLVSATKLPGKYVILSV